jgi:Trypsin
MRQISKSVVCIVGIVLSTACSASPEGTSEDVDDDLSGDFELRGASSGQGPSPSARVQLLLDGKPQGSGTLVSKSARRIVTARHVYFEFVTPISRYQVLFNDGTRTNVTAAKTAGTTADLTVLVVSAVPASAVAASIGDKGTPLVSQEKVAITGSGPQTQGGTDNASRWGTLTFSKFKGTDGPYSSALEFRSAGGDAIPCTGDSGGGIFQKQGGAWSLVGVLSSGPSRCEDKAARTIPITAADARSWRRWILE